MPELKDVSAAKKNSHPTPATEREETEEWIFTINTKTGEVTRIEKLDMGQRHQLSEDEYAALASVYPLAVSPASDAAEEMNGDEEPESEPMEQEPSGPSDYLQAYYLGMSDYATALAASYSYTPQEAAYLQGMMDYAASVP